jgi:hypothetical protein
MDETDAAKVVAEDCKIGRSSVWEGRRVRWGTQGFPTMPGMLQAMVQVPTTSMARVVWICCD